MSAIEISRRVGAPAAAVWELITDLDGSPQRLSGVESIERLSGPEFGVGTRWRETRVMLGRRASEEMEVTAIEPGSAYTVAAASHGMSYVSAWSVAAVDEGETLLTMRFEADPETAVARVAAATLGRLFASATRKALARDLDEISAAAESGSG